jgi:hypothetical protein
VKGFNGEEIVIPQMIPEILQRFRVCNIGDRQRRHVDYYFTVPNLTLADVNVSATYIDGASVKTQDFFTCPVYSAAFFLNFECCHITFCFDE